MKTSDPTVIDSCQDVDECTATPGTGFTGSIHFLSVDRRIHKKPLHKIYAVPIHSVQITLADLHVNACPAFSPPGK